MEIKKHSYILSKDGFILCVLASGRDYYAGEILYGQEPTENCPIKVIDGKQYFKYWAFQSGNRKLEGRSGEKTSYSHYYKSASELYKQFSFDHPLIGQLFKVDTSRIKKVWSPLPFAELQKEPQSMVTSLAELLNINPNNINLGGSNMLYPDRISKTDFDIILNSEKASSAMVKMIRKLTNDPVYSEKSKNGHIHHRRFILNGVNICPFGSSANDSVFEQLDYKLIHEPVEIEAKVINDSDSLLSPSQYKVLVKGKEMSLISYHVAHTALLKIGNTIKLKAAQYEFNIKGKSVLSIVIPIEGTWIEIN